MTLRGQKPLRYSLKRTLKRWQRRPITTMETDTPPESPESSDSQRVEACVEPPCYALPSRREGADHFRCEPDEATHLWFRFANEDFPRCLPVQTKGTRAGTGNWTWNGDKQRPTLRPSLATNFGTHKCHVWINEGMVQHLGDCTCGLAGQTQHLALPDVDDYFSEHNTKPMEG